MIGGSELTLFRVYRRLSSYTMKRKFARYLVTRREESVALWRRSRPLDLSGLFLSVYGVVEKAQDNASCFGAQFFPRVDMLGYISTFRSRTAARGQLGFAI